MKHPHRKERFTIRTADIDAEGFVSPIVLCGFLQELAINHADQLGVGMRHIIAGSGHTWMLSRMRVSFAPRGIGFGEEIRVLTWPAGVQGRVVAVRDFRVTDSQGEEILRAETEWLYVNITRQRIARLPEIITDMIPLVASRIELPAMPEFDEAASLDATAEIRVRRADLDLNNHVNHTHIIAWLFEPVELKVEESEKNAQQQLASLDISFRQEALLGDTLVSQASRPSPESKITYHKILRNDTVIAQAVMGWGG